MVMMMMMPLVAGAAAATYFFFSALRGSVERKIPLSHYTNSIQSTARAIHRRPPGAAAREELETAAGRSVEARGNDVKLKQSG